jgi:hypothetical protein
MPTDKPQTTLSATETKLIKSALYMAILWEESRIDAGVTNTVKLRREAQKNIENFTKLRMKL